MMHERFVRWTCEGCGIVVTRPIVIGRPPSYCGPDCRRQVRNRRRRAAAAAKRAKVNLPMASQHAVYETR